MRAGEIQSAPHAVPVRPWLYGLLTPVSADRVNHKFAVARIILQSLEVPGATIEPQNNRDWGKQKLTAKQTNPKNNL